MNLIALGINHNYAAVEVRERVAFAPEQAAEALADACAVAHLEELVILSTCNRTEIYPGPAPPRLPRAPPRTTRNRRASTSQNFVKLVWRLLRSS